MAADALTLTAELMEALMRDPVALFKALSAYCHMQAEQQADAAHAVGVPTGPNPWGETAELIDMALMFWQEQEYPLEVKHRLMTSHLERITERVKSYLRP